MIFLCAGSAPCGETNSILHSDCGKSDRKSVIVLIVRRCAGAAQFSISEGEVGPVGRDRSDQRVVRLGSPRSPEESGVDISWLAECIWKPRLTPEWGVLMSPEDPREK